MDLGDQVAYLVLAEGTPVYSSDDTELGRVARVLGAADQDIFDGIILAVSSSESRYVQADSIDAIYERGVVLALDDAAAANLPLPAAEA